MDLEVEADKMIRDAGARPAFKGYYTQSAGSKYPFVLCTSLNDEMVHGMPSAKTVLKKGDIVSIDTGSRTGRVFRRFGRSPMPVGEPTRKCGKLLRVNEESLELAIDKCGRETGCSISAVRSSGTS